MSVMKNEPSQYGQGQGSVGAIHVPSGMTISGHFVEVAPSDPTGQASIASKLAADINSLGNWLSGQGWRTGFYYISDPHSGAAQTPGEPPGIAIIHFTSGSNWSYKMCISPASFAPVSGQPLQQVPPAAPASTSIWTYLLLGAVGLAVVGGIVYYATE